MADLPKAEWFQDSEADRLEGEREQRRLRASLVAQGEHLRGNFVFGGKRYAYRFYFLIYDFDAREVVVERRDGKPVENEPIADERV